MVAMERVEQLPEQRGIEEVSQRLHFETASQRRLAVGALAVVELGVLALGIRQLTHERLDEKPSVVQIAEPQPHHLTAHKHHHHHHKSHPKPAHKTADIKTVPTAVPALPPQPTEHVGRGKTAAVEQAHVQPHHSKHWHKTNHPHHGKAFDLEHLFGNGISADISWPKNNCKALIPDFVEFGRVGLNGGNNFEENSCLKREVRKFGVLPTSLYVNSGFHSKNYALKQKPQIKEDCPHQSAACVAKHWGYLAGLFDIQLAIDNHVYEPNIAIDVEGQIPAWSHNKTANTASLKGEIAGLKAGARRAGLIEPMIEFYYAPSGWNAIAGNSQFKHIPVWLAHGHVSKDVARAACDDQDETYHTHSGGPLVAVQYVVDDLRVQKPKHPNKWVTEDLDLSVACPAQFHSVYHPPEWHNQHDKKQRAQHKRKAAHDLASGLRYSAYVDKRRPKQGAARRVPPARLASSSAR